MRTPTLPRPPTSIERAAIWAWSRIEMLSYAEIREARPSLWSESGDEWLSIAQHVWMASDDLNDVRMKIPQGWLSPAGQLVSRVAA
jgi:hypothetical protein